MGKYLLLSFDGINDVQREQIQTIVEDETNNWWHQQANVWIVETDEGPDSWRDQFSRVLHAEPATLLVLPLDADGKYAGRAPGGRARSKLGGVWLKENLGEKTRKALRAADSSRTGNPS